MADDSPSRSESNAGLYPADSGLTPDDGSTWLGDEQNYMQFPHRKLGAVLKLDEAIAQKRSEIVAGGWNDWSYKKLDTEE